MAYCLKVPVKEVKLRTYGHLWKYSFISILKKLKSNADRIDIIYDVYLEAGIKQQKRNRRDRRCPIVGKKINSTKEHLPLALDKFWVSSRNKMQLWRLFITWLCDIYSREKSEYLDGTIPDNIISCVKVCGGHTSCQGLLKCFHEEVDGPMLIHVDHVVRVKNF